MKLIRAIVSGSEAGRGPAVIGRQLGVLVGANVAIALLFSAGFAAAQDAGDAKPASTIDVKSDADTDANAKEEESLLDAQTQSAARPPAATHGRARVRALGPRGRGPGRAPGWDRQHARGRARRPGRR